MQNIPKAQDSTHYKELPGPICQQCQSRNPDLVEENGNKSTGMSTGA